MTRSAAGTNLVSGNFPAAKVLKDDGKNVRPFVADKILNGDGIFTDRYSGKIKFRCIRIHAVSAEYAAIESAVRAGIGASIEQVKVAELRFCAGKSVFVIRYGAGDAVKIGLQRRNSAGLESLYVAAGALIESLLGCGFNCLACRLGDFVLALAGLGPCRKASGQNQRCCKNLECKSHHKSALLRFLLGCFRWLLRCTMFRLSGS